MQEGLMTTERKELERLTSALPKTADGVTMVPGMEVWYLGADFPFTCCSEFLTKDSLTSWQCYAHQKNAVASQVNKLDTALNSAKMGLEQ